MNTKCEDLYEEWSGENRHVNDCHPVHDSSETVEFAEYYHKEMMSVGIEKFIEKVERRAETKMLKTGKLEGSHYAAMKELQKELEVGASSGLFAGSPMDGTGGSAGLQDGVEVEYYKLAYGAKFKYKKSAETTWLKLPDNLIAEYDTKYMTVGGWQGQMICSFDDDNNHNRKVWAES